MIFCAGSVLWVGWRPSMTTPWWTTTWPSSQCAREPQGSSWRRRKVSHLWLFHSVAKSLTLKSEILLEESIEFSCVIIFCIFHCFHRIRWVHPPLSWHFHKHFFRIFLLEKFSPTRLMPHNKIRMCNSQVHPQSPLMMQFLVSTRAANDSSAMISQSRRRPLWGPSHCWKLVLSYLRHYAKRTMSPPWYVWDTNFMSLLTVG